MRVIKSDVAQLKADVQAARLWLVQSAPKDVKHQEGYSEYVKTCERITKRGFHSGDVLKSPDFDDMYEQILKSRTGLGPGKEGATRSGATRAFLLKAMQKAKVSRRTGEYFTDNEVFKPLVLKRSGNKSVPLLPPKETPAPLPSRPYEHPSDIRMELNVIEQFLGIKRLDDGTMILPAPKARSLKLPRLSNPFRAAWRWTKGKVHSWTA